MTDEQKAAYVFAQAACLMAEVAGMQAENMQREYKGEAMAYVENDFQSAINRYGVHHNGVCTTFQG